MFNRTDWLLDLRRVKSESRSDASDIEKAENSVQVGGNYDIFLLALENKYRLLTETVLKLCIFELVKFCALGSNFEFVIQIFAFRNKTNKPPII
jgi:hypothetical protein